MIALIRRESYAPVVTTGRISRERAMNTSPTRMTAKASSLSRDERHAFRECTGPDVTKRATFWWPRDVPQTHPEFPLKSTDLDEIPHPNDENACQQRITICPAYDETTLESQTNFNWEAGI